jgi:hypothetical protein
MASPYWLRLNERNGSTFHTPHFLVRRAHFLAWLQGHHRRLAAAQARHGLIIGCSRIDRECVLSQNSRRI